MRASRFLIALAAAQLMCVLLPAVEAGTTTCGDGKKNKCGNWFNSCKCDQDGACCTDSFNSWCCPENFKCNGVYHDPGGSTRCMTPEHHSQSCVCKDTSQTIISMTPYGVVRAKDASNSNLQACCDVEHTNECGWSTAFTVQNREALSWETTAGIKASLGFQAEVPGVMLTAGFEAHASFTTGQVTENTHGSTYSSQCTCNADNCYTPWTKLTYELEFTLTEQPVKLIVRQCGVDTEVEGVARMQKFSGRYTCAAEQFDSGEACTKAEEQTRVESLILTTDEGATAWLDAATVKEAGKTEL